MQNLLSHVKIDKEILTFGDIEIEKINFTIIKVLFFQRIYIYIYIYIYIEREREREKVFVSNKISSLSRL